MTTTDQATAAADGVVNGVVVEALRASRAAMTAAPAAARFTWRVRNRWVDGTHSTSTVHDFHGAGGPQRHVVEQLVGIHRGPARRRAA